MHFNLLIAAFHLEFVVEVPILNKNIIDGLLLLQNTCREACVSRNLQTGLSSTYPQAKYSEKKNFVISCELYNASNIQNFVLYSCTIHPTYNETRQ